MYDKYDSYNSHLTNLAQGLVLYPGKEIDLTGIFFPAVGVETMVGSFDKFDLETGLTPVDTSLTRDNSPRRIQLRKTEGFWNCKPNAVEMPTFGPELLQKGHAAQIREGHIRRLISSMFVSRQAAAVKAVKEAVGADANLGSWTSSSDIVGELDSLCKSVVEGCGCKPNKLLIGHSTWSKLRNHPAILDRLPGLGYGLTPEALQEVLSYKGLDIIIVDSMANVGGEMVELLAHDIIALHNEEMPSLEDMSFGKEFTLNTSGPEVLSYKEFGGVNEVDVLMWSSDCQVVHPGACARMEVTAA